MRSVLINKAPNNNLNLKEVSAVLGVSSATVINWVRHKHISPVNLGQSLFSSFDVERLRNDLQNGVINRLNKRANKLGAGRTFIPTEYFNRADDQEKLNNIISSIQGKHLTLDEAMFLLSLNTLIKAGIVSRVTFDEIQGRDKIKSLNRQIHQEILSWHKSIPHFSVDRTAGNRLLEVEIPVHSDILGLLYQSLLSEGHKSQKGSYYTPPEIVEAICREYAQRSAKFLDPCCGSGQFLLSFSNIIEDPRNLYGIDIDDIAVRIARINLLIKFKDYDFEPNIFCKDAILDINIKDLFAAEDARFCDFDVIATNPPWGVHFTQDEAGRLFHEFPIIKSFESFSYFLKVSIDSLRQNGVLSFILPESILNVMAHRDIRRYIIDNTSIEKITYLDRVFRNVFTPVIRLDLRKTQESNQQIFIHKAGSSYSINQNRLENNEGYVFDIHCDDRDEKIIDKIYGVAHVTLKNSAEWALGIVTGDNKKYLLQGKVSGAEEILKGSDVNKYVCGPASSYIVFNPNLFQQVAPESKYRAPEKLIYRFISKQLVFAYDNHQKLTLNSANIVIPRIKNYPIKAIMALFNSCLYQFIFQKKFSSIKVLRSHLEQLPLPLLERDVLAKLCKNVDAAIAGDLDSSEIDDFIFSQFNLYDQEIQRVRKAVNGFIKE